MINSQKYTKLLITKNQKKNIKSQQHYLQENYQNKKKAQFLFPGRYRDPGKHTAESQRKISDPNSALFLISQENQNQKKVEKKNEFPFPDNKSTKRNTHNKRNHKEKYQNLILTKT